MIACHFILSRTSQNRVKRILSWVGLVISVALLYLALRGLHLADVWASLSTARYYWILPGIAIYFFGVWARTWRWSFMLRPFKSVPLVRLFPVVCIGYAGNNIYPARVGEVIRSFVLKKTEDIPMSGSLPTVFVERIFDGLVMLLFVFIALPFAPNVPPVYRAWVIGFSLLFGVALAIFIFVASRPALAKVPYDWVVRVLVPERFHPKLDGLFERLMLGLSSLTRGRDVIMIFATSVVIWLAETMKYWFVMHAFDFQVSFLVLMLMNGIVNLFTTLPAAPGYIGTFDAPGIKILQVVGGVPGGIAAAYTLTLHAALWVPITLLGVWYFYRKQLHWSDFQAAADAAAVCYG